MANIETQEHLAVRALKDDSFLELGDSETLEIALQLQRLLRGQDSLLEKMSKVDKNAARMSDEMTKLKQRSAELEAFAQTFEDNRAQYMNAWRDKAEGVPEEVRSQSIAEATQNVSQMVQYLKANKNVDDLKKKAWMKSQDVMKMTRPGKPVATPQGVVMEAEVVSLNGMRYVLPPNVEVEVPRSVAEYLESQDLDRAMANEKKALMDANIIKKDTVVAQGMRAIDAKYGIKSEPVPVASRV
jgi:myosin heavy subunit